MGKNIKGLNFIDGIMPPQPIIPHDDGYIAHNNLEISKKFPNCCNFHKDAFVMLEKWFESVFPAFMNKMEVKYKEKFNKNDYEGHTLKIIRQISYTEYFISKKINNSNWYDEIRHYLDYNLLCLGVPQLGFGIYVYYVLKYLQTIEKNIVQEKRDKLISYCHQLLNHDDTNGNEHETIDINDISATIEKWEKVFPFELFKFSDFKIPFDQISVIITSSGDYNHYAGLTLIDNNTKSELINLLLTTTKEILNSVNGANRVKMGESIQTLNKYKLDVLVENHIFRQKKLLNDFSLEEYTYINLLDKWFEYEKDFLENYLKTINTINANNTVFPIKGKSSNLLTLNSRLSKIQLERLRIILMEQSYISEISNDDFLYLFQNRPIVPSMIKLNWLKPNSWCHYLLKEIVFVEKNFNFQQLNSCIIGFEGKKLDSNSNKGEYKEIDDLLKSIIE